MSLPPNLPPSLPPSGDDVDLEDYVNRPEKISAADVAAIAQVGKEGGREEGREGGRAGVSVLTT